MRSPGKLFQSTSVISRSRCAPLMGAVRHWAARYVASRAWRLRAAWRQRHRSWLCPEAMCFLDEWLKPIDIGFQWGSGDGTLWLARRIQHLTSVEYDPARARRVRAQLQAQGLTERVAYHLSTPGAAAGNLDAEYLLAIDTVTDHSLDVCLVSGPAPSACCLASILKLKPGSLLVLEHADRYLSHNGELTTALEEWQYVVWHLASWRPVWIPNGLSETAIFIKP